MQGKLPDRPALTDFCRRIRRSIETRGAPVDGAPFVHLSGLDIERILPRWITIAYGTGSIGGDIVQQPSAPAGLCLAPSSKRS